MLQIGSTAPPPPKVCGHVSKKVFFIDTFPKESSVSYVKIVKLPRNKTNNKLS